MTVLRALQRHHERLVSVGEAPHYGFSREAVDFALVISIRGRLVGVEALHDTTGATPRPTTQDVPQRVLRGPKIVPNFLWDKTAYVLGVKRNPVTQNPIPAVGEHDAFRKFHLELLSVADDAVLQALRRFLDYWNPADYASLPSAHDMLDRNLVFRVDGELYFLHQRPRARDIWLAHLGRQEAAQGVCLVSGAKGRLARLHPRIRGVRGALSSGASIVSFGRDAFESYGKKQGANAPVSLRAAFAYASALNSLLARGSRRRVFTGDTTVVFWAEASRGHAAANAAEQLFATLADPPPDPDEQARIAETLRAIGSGRALADAFDGVDEEMRLHVLGLSSNAARLFLRFWHADSLGAIVRRILDHWRDVRIDPPPWQAPPSVWRLLVETAPQRDSERIAPVLSGPLMQSIFTGAPYPGALLAAVMTRMRQDHDINGARAAICKACIARDFRLGLTDADVPVSLNLKEINAAYRLGRLFAVYENIQMAVQGISNASIRDRYFGVASAAPATMFELLERSATHHLASLRDNNQAPLTHWFEQEIDGILAGMDTSLPRSLSLEEQGRFVVGYYHQRGARRRSSANSIPSPGTVDRD